jgi:hypothetical protein
MKDFYTTQTAAVYLGCAVRTVKYHLYIAKDLKPDETMGHALIFSRATLDEFRKHKRPGGRPKTRDL